MNKERRKSSSGTPFDAIVVANGHYSKPRSARFLGADVFPGKQMHSSTYKEPSVFTNQNVVLIGRASLWRRYLARYRNKGEECVFERKDMAKCRVGVESKHIGELVSETKR